MPDPISGSHLQLSDLGGGDVVKKLEDYGSWTGTLEKDFKPLTPEVYKCMHEEREQKLKPVLDALGYPREVCELDDQINSADAEKSVATQTLRILKRSYINAGRPGADLFPVRIQRVAGGWDESAAGRTAAVGKAPAGCGEAAASKIAATRDDDVAAGSEATVGSDQLAAGRSETAGRGSGQAVPGTVYDDNMNPLGLVVGQKLHITRPVIVDPGIDIVLIQQRGPINGS
jgi:hypothetical protein